MTKDRRRIKGRRVGGSFIMIPHAILEHPNYAKLTPRAVKLLIDLYGQYNGQNNGDFCASMSVMKKRGWRSKDQLHKAKNELLVTRWIIQTKQGGLGIGPSLFAVTFQSIDECGGKLEVDSTKTALGLWKIE